MAAVKTICFDLDGVLCSKTDGDYETAQPNPKAIEMVNRLHAQGHRVIIHTSRFMGRHKGDAEAARREGLEYTAGQLRKWGVQFDELFLGKPVYDVVVDDRAIFFREDWDEIYRTLAAE